MLTSLAYLCVIAPLTPPSVPEVPISPRDTLGALVAQYDPPEYLKIDTRLSPVLLFDSWLVSLTDPGVIVFPGDPLPVGTYLNASEFDTLLTCSGWDGEFDKLLPGGLIQIYDRASDDGPSIILGPGSIVCNDGFYACCRKGPPKKSKCVKDATNPPPECDAGGPGTKACSPPD